MSDIMTPIPFGKMMNWILEEHKKGAIFGIRRPFVADQSKKYEIFGRTLETPFGPAAGPHTQLTQNIVAAYVAGSRFFELKTVQKLDGEDLPVAKPCIKADDECYNCEWSTELYVPQAYDEYVKAWFACKVLAKEYGLGSMDGFQFNMSVGYDLDGIKLEKVDRFIEGMKDASAAPIFNECRQWLLDNLDRFDNLTKEDVESISPEICNCATLSTLHGCPPQEIERIASYLLTEKKVHTFIKCNPTLLGYEYARKLMDDMGYDYVAFGDFHFRDDLQYTDAVPMLQRLQKLADKKGLEFGVKITNTFPVDVKQNELPSEEMYMSGKSLYALSMSVAQKLAKDFDGKLRISYSGGADYFNITKIVDAGIWPVTMATTMLKPGGYERLEQIGQLFKAKEAAAFAGVSAEKVEAMVEAAKSDKHHVKAVKPLPSRKVKKPVPLTDCFIAPCQEGCPIHQDITRYMQLAGEGKYEEALKVILNKNPLPFITGTICAHNCMSKCTRNFYEASVDIRRTKLESAQGGIDAVMAALKAPAVTSDKKAAVVGGGPAGLAAAYFLAKGGMKVTVFEKAEKMGGVVRNVIPGFRISHEAIDHDVELVRAMGAELVNGKEITSVDELKKEYDYVVLAVGASEPGRLRLEAGETMNALEFLAQFKATDGKVDLGKNVVVIGGGNTEKVGNCNPDFMLGWSNTFTYKGFSLYFLIDGRFGGDVLSQTQAELDQRGVSLNSGKARDAGYINIDGTQVKPRKFYTAVSGRDGCTEYYMYDATNIRLRELSLGYSLPQSWLAKAGGAFKDVQLSFVARNLFFISKKAPFDPDAVLSTGNDNQGIDVFGMPTTRSLGFNIKFTF